MMIFLLAQLVECYGNCGAPTPRNSDDYYQSTPSTPTEVYVQPPEAVPPYDYQTDTEEFNSGDIYRNADPHTNQEYTCVISEDGKDVYCY